MTFLDENNEKLINYLLEHSSTLTYKNYKSKQVLVNQGDKIENIGIIRNGLLEIVKYTYCGDRKSHEYLDRNALIPIYHHLEGIKEYRYTLICEIDAQIAWIDKVEFDKIIKKEPEILYDMLIHIARRGYKAQLQLVCMNYNKVVERLAYWIVEMHHMTDDKDYIELPKTQSILADELCVNRSSLNQELKNLIDEGLIKIDRKKLKVLDIEKLKQNY